MVRFRQIREGATRIAACRVTPDIATLESASESLTDAVAATVEAKRSARAGDLQTELTLLSVKFGAQRGSVLRALSDEAADLARDLGRRRGREMVKADDEFGRRLQQLRDRTDASEAAFIVECVAGIDRLGVDPVRELEAKQVVAAFREEFPAITVPNPGPEPQPDEGELEPPNIEVTGVVWAINTGRGFAKKFGKTRAQQEAVLLEIMPDLLAKREGWERRTAAGLKRFLG